ncbi:hypothetical protein SODALDRAFT_346764 [Sodiomyces alkalinus F11]|uniref:Uncharacterized protein n=1 Tax=Sodiomyces alkalinus (strain CBS 110278 / VKM F-3762 / F11) TaxID=1314773 RepID=A0A3N2PJF1_SODAK|nr:hypothetical protein SODALDRAFT_346764 [Sodiomyces alkalinus F11]ROT34657.1 hypothetical protein SODALDRAFT_346764 [Sodiomyces alkalinus F11]
MASPLSPTKQSTLNLATPPTSRRHFDQYEVHVYTEQSSSSSSTTTTTTSTTPPSYATTATTSSSAAVHLEIDAGPSSRPGKENVMSPPKQRHSRIMSGNELSPLKILSASEPNFDRQLSSPARASRKSILSPEKRFPVRSSRSGSRERTVSLEDAIFEDDDDEGKDKDEDRDVGAHSPQSVDKMMHHDNSFEAALGPDDTMMSAFSTFSAVPEMTMLAKFGNSPTRPDPSPSRTARPMSVQQDSSGNTTNLLMDFTDQLRFPGRANGRPTNTSSPPNNLNGFANSYMATPARAAQSLLDFDIPPMPTPRSIPTVTPRELESLKSSFLSEISSLKASLSGKEAEVQSLKTAVGDAEKRVGESMERVREVESEREQLVAEKEGWERRSREMESVLRSVKEEIVLGQREREELEYKLSESEQRREAAETMAQEAESKLAGMRAGRATEENARDKARSPGGGNGNSSSSSNNNQNASREVEMAVERVARELHALYKSKHETKVAALKKSYEGRWEKKVRELENKLGELGEENERLRLGRDATMTRVDHHMQAAEEERKAQAIHNSAQIKELGAEVDKLHAVLRTVQDDNAELRALLETERVEKGELVMLAEEMMAMQTTVASPAQPSTVRKTQPMSAAAAPPPPPQPSSEPTQARTPGKMRTPGPASRTQAQSGNENLRGSISRPSGLKAPGSSIVMPGRGGAAQHERTRSGAGPGLPRPGSGFGPRSGIISNIERMGNYRGRGE